MNKKISFIILIIILGVGFLFTNSAQAIKKFADKEIFVDFDGLPFDLSNFAPGMNTSTETITIINNENFDIDVYFKAEKTSGDPNNYLANSLIVNIDNESNYLSDLLNTNITLGSIGSNASQSYDIFINFDKNAGNNSQNETIDFDFILTVVEEHQDEDDDDDENGDIPPIIIPGGGGSRGSSGAAAFCGDGDIDEFKGEECDDGNNIDGDGCSSSCKKEGEVKGESTEGEEETGEEGKGTDTGTGSSDTLGQGKEKGEVAGAETEEIQDEEESKKNLFSAFIINLITFDLSNVLIILLLLIILAIIIYYFKQKAKKKEF